MQQGELTVTGHDFATIPLHSFPTKVECHFKGHEMLVPCNPHHHDWIEAEVHHSNTVRGKFVLKISWQVSGVREVVWRVWY